MRKSLLIYITILTITSCCYKTYINGVVESNDTCFSKKIKSDINCIVLESLEHLPDSAKFITSLEYYSPSIFAWPATLNDVPYNVMVKKTKNYAKQKGANIIQIEDYGLTKNFLRYYFKVKLYSIDQKLFTHYKFLQDSLNNDNKSYCIAHVKCRLYSKDKIGIYFNKLIAGEFDYSQKDGRDKYDAESMKDWGGGFRVPIVTIKSPVDGSISVTQGAYPKIKDIKLKKGKEYYFQLIWNKYRGITLMETSKEKF